MASSSARPISPSSARSALIASSTPGLRRVSIWSVILRSCCSSPEMSCVGTARARRRGHRRRQWLLLGHRRSRGCRRRRGRCRGGLAVERALAGGDFRQGAVERRRQLHIRPRRHGRRLRHHRLRRHGGRQRRRHGLARELVEPLVEPPDQRGGLALVALAPRRVGGRTGAGEVLDAAGKIVEPLVHAREFFAVVWSPGHEAARRALLAWPAAGSRC